MAAQENLKISSVDCGALETEPHRLHVCCQLNRCESSRMTSLCLYSGGDRVSTGAHMNAHSAALCVSLQVFHNAIYISS